MRKVIIAGNWKMYKTQGEAAEFLMEFIPQIDDAPESREVVLCVPFTDLTIVNKSLHGNRVRLGAQNVHWEESGAYKIGRAHV